jgi:hypothetical protein
LFERLSFSIPVSQFAVLKYSDKKAIQFQNRLDKKNWANQKWVKKILMDGS